MTGPRILARAALACALATLTLATLPLGPAALAADPPIALRLATPEDPDRPSQPFLDTFAAEVERASGGSMSVEILYGAGGHEADKEPVAARRVLSGDVELAVIPSRAWTDAGVTSVQALMAPFLIDSDELLRAVASDASVLQPMMDGMAEQGLVGLAIWPENLRHLFTFDENGPPMVAPSDLEGQTLFVVGSSLQNQIIEALGATPNNTFPPDELVRDGTLGGAEYSLAFYNLYSPATVTADVTFYPKYQTLVAEDSAWSRLSAEQQDVIRQAAATAREAMIAGLPTDASLLQAFCDQGNGAVLAGPENVAAFQSAAQPIYDQLRQDRATAAAIDAISALKASLDVAPISTSCERVAQAAAAPVASGPPIGPIPDGTYRLTNTKEALLARGVNAMDSTNNAGEWTLRVGGLAGSWTLDHPDGFHEVCSVTYTNKGDHVRMDFVSGCDGWVDLRWTLDDDQLTLMVVGTNNETAYDVAATDGILRGPWTKVE
jgi:TRAP-type C4-dicarboxylate transport system substrate-binding protein